MTLHDDNIHYPSGFGLSDVIAWGTTGLVVLDRSSNTVIKTPFDPQSEKCIERISREREVYERFTRRGSHEGVLAFYGIFEQGLRLEFAPNFTLRAYNQDHTDRAQRLRWAMQIAQAIKFIHGAGVIHGDLTCANIYLDKGLNARVGDFAGSSVDGSPLLVLVTESHAFPGSPLSIQADLFAFGSVIYEIMTTHCPYDGLDETEITARYARGEFPETESLGAIGTIIKKCWQGAYSASDEIINDLIAEETKESNLPSVVIAGTITLATIGVVVMSLLLFGRRRLARIH
ncbi:kinase-like protein [Hypoxylon sp. NC1633]|nr:kinase-like protein [Hypoxylon sp. NC1633]